MALKTFRPTIPGLRQLVLVDQRPPVEGRAGQDAGRGQVQDGRAQQPRPHHHAPHRRRPQADLSAGRFPPPQARHAGEGRAARVRSEPHRVHRAASSTRTASWPTSWRRSAWPWATGWSSGVKADVKPGNAMPLASHADRHDRAQHRAQGRRRRQDRALGRRLRAARRPRRRLGDPEAQLGRDAARARGMHGDGRRGLQPRPRERVDRQGRPHALAGHAARRCARSP